MIDWDGAFEQRRPQRLCLLAGDLIEDFQRLRNLIGIAVCEVVMLGGIVFEIEEPDFIRLVVDLQLPFSVEDGLVRTRAPEEGAMRRAGATSFNKRQDVDTIHHAI